MTSVLMAKIKVGTELNLFGGYCGYVNTTQTLTRGHV